LSQQTLALKEILVYDSPISGMVSIENDLFILSHEEGSLLKVKLDSDTIEYSVVVEGLSYPTDLVFNGDYIYISETGKDRISNEGFVYKINVNEENPTPIVVISDLDGPSDVLVHGDELFVSEFSGGRIRQYSDILNATLSYELEKDLLIYPNPANNIIHVDQHSKSSNYVIIDGQGISVKKGVTNPNNQIEIGDLSAGLYFLKINDFSTKKFIVE